MDLTTFFAPLPPPNNVSAPPVTGPDLVPVEAIEAVRAATDDVEAEEVERPKSTRTRTKSTQKNDKSTKPKARSKPTTKKSSVVAKPLKVIKNLKKNSPAQRTTSENFADLDDGGIDDHDGGGLGALDEFDIPDQDSQYDEDEEEENDVNDPESECGDDHACLDEDIDDDDPAGFSTYDGGDLNPSYSRCGAWKRRDKTTLPCPDLVGPPLTPDDDSHIM